MILEAIKLAASSIWQYKARAVLTVLGIVIGISSVVMFLAVGEGLRRDVTTEITALGTNLVSIFPGEFDPAGGSFSTTTISGDILTLDDVRDLSQLPDVEAATPYMLVGGVLRRADKVAPNALLFGTTSNIVETLSTIEINHGRMFTEAEDAAQSRVIVLGPGIAKILFGEDQAVGQTVLIGKVEFDVIGITKVPDTTGVVGGSDYQTMVLMPIQTAGDISGGVKVMRIMLALGDDVDPKAFIATIERTMEVRHALEDFSVLTQDDLLGTVNKILGQLTTAIAGIAAISLVVAGVGIMNIMLVSVTERTKEIGLRKAVGATTSMILWQFLIESVVLSVLGALVAVTFAWGAAQLAVAYSPLTPVVTTEAITLAVGVGVTVGLIFGIAPALRAARLDPIAALRSE